MLKKIYIKNGIIMISEINNMDMNYNIINDKNILNKIDYNENKKKYYEKLGCVYDKN